jgi:hypothetical protein
MMAKTSGLVCILSVVCKCLSCVQIVGWIHWVSYIHLFVLFLDLRRHSFMVQSYGDSDSESLASTTISSGASDNRDLSELVEVKSVSCSGPSEVKTNLVIKFCSDEEDLSNLAAGKSVGFIIGLSLQSTFVALREAIDTNNLEGLPPAGTWKFFIPNLAVMSSDQESVFTVGSLPYLGDDNPRVIYVCRP